MSNVVMGDFGTHGFQMRYTFTLKAIPYVRTINRSITDSLYKNLKGSLLNLANGSTGDFNGTGIQRRCRERCLVLGNVSNLDESESIKNCNSIRVVFIVGFSFQYNVGALGRNVGAV